jgi:hypothetical protein
MVVFLVATMMVLAAVAVPNILVQGRREREEETVWRGEQYKRAVGMYFRKFGRYPTKMDDLTKQTNGVRFLRQAYTDPMNKDDGSWRFIYVGPNGQLIGSLRSTSLQQLALSASGIPGLGTQQGSPSGANPGGTSGAASQSNAGDASGAAGAAGAAGQSGQSGQQTNSALAPNPLASQPQPLQGATIGGNIIGVGSKVKEPSLRVYEGGDTYEQWEFIWNPLLQVGGVPGQQGVNPNAPTGTQPAPGTALPQKSPANQ